MDHHNYECSPLPSPQTEPPSSPDAVDPARLESTNQTLGCSTQCMRPLGQPEAVSAQIAPMGAQTPTRTPTNDHPEKHADPFQLSSQSPLPPVQQPRLRFPPSPPSTFPGLESSLVAVRPDERPSGILGVASDSTTTVASVLESAIPGDEDFKLLVPLRIRPTTSSSPITTAPNVVKTCDFIDRSGLPTSYRLAMQKRMSLSMVLDLGVVTPMDSQQADDSSPDDDGTCQDGIISASSLFPSNLTCHAATVPAPTTLVAFSVSETDTTTGMMGSGCMTPKTSTSSLLLDVQQLYDGSHDSLAASNATPTSFGLGMPDDLATENEMPPSGRLPPSSLPASQVSDFALSANHTDVAPTLNAEHHGSCDEDNAMLDLGSIRTKDSSMDVQAPSDQIASDTYAGTFEGFCPVLETSGEEDMVELPPSSPPSSSPPGLFSSPARSISGSPPSSSPVGPPCDVEDQLPSLGTRDVDPSSPSSPLKRAREADESPETVEISSTGYGPLKRIKSPPSSQANLPNPTRPTQASQARQHKKLAAPFRSPVIKGPLVHGGLHAVYASGRVVAPVVASTRPAEEDVTEDTTAAESNTHAPNKDRTARAAKQFKPPMQLANPIASSNPSSATATSTVSRVRAVPTIQALQGQVQTLKQAIKIKNSGDGVDDEVLEQLVKKWTAVGREVAWALWDHVKDLDPGTGAPPQGGGWHADDDADGTGTKRGLNSSWGYGDDEPVRKKARMDEDVDQEEPPAEQHTIGVMLRRLGIDPDTLGWDEDEGDFVDV